MVGWLQQRCPSKFFDDHICVHTCVWPGIVVEEQQFWHSSCGTNSLKVWIQTYMLIQQSELHIILQGKKFSRIWLLIPKAVAMTFSADSTLLNFFSLGVVMFWQETLNYCTLSLLKIGVRCFLCLSVHLYKHFWCLGIAKLCQTFWTWILVAEHNVLKERKVQCWQKKSWLQSSGLREVVYM
jgi:hypothetical protein